MGDEGVLGHIDQIRLVIEKARIPSTPLDRLKNVAAAVAACGAASYGTEQAGLVAAYLTTSASKAMRRSAMGCRKTSDSGVTSRFDMSS